MIHLRDHATVVATGLREPVHIQHESIDETGSRYRVVLTPGTGVLGGTRLNWHDTLIGLSRIIPVRDHAGRLNRWEGVGTEISDLIDIGSLYRQNGTTYDPDANTEVPVWEPTWTGPCLVLVPAGGGVDAEAGQQMITVQPFTVQVPLEVTDIRPDDQFRVTSSQDPRLITRVLEVTRVKAESMAAKREFTAVDNQG
jgi:hypothetical protein